MWSLLNFWKTQLNACHDNGLDCSFVVKADMAGVSSQPFPRLMTGVSVTLSKMSKIKLLELINQLLSFFPQYLVKERLAIILQACFLFIA